MKRIPVLLAALFVGFNAVIAQSDSALRTTIEKDRSARTADGPLGTLSAFEHLARGRVYFDNRQFPQAREHFQKIIDNYKTDPAMSGALFMMGRSYYWERNYEQCVPYLDRVSREYPGTKDGREGLYFEASCDLRVGRNDDAARLWQQYETAVYPAGERVENAYVNAIDALREAKRYQEAEQQVAATRAKFPGTTTETNALHALLRMQIFKGQYSEAASTAALLQTQARFAGSMTSLDEVKYLRAFALEKQGKKGEANAVYGSITPSSYYGGLVADKVSGGGNLRATPYVMAANTSDFPAAFRAEVLAAAKPRKIDPRFILALIRQESTFKPDARSPAAARGLMQQTIDTAMKYNVKAGYPNLRPEDLYDPQINITIACENIADLQDQFGGMYEPVAASYNGGDDNAARWLSHSNPKEPGIFASEVGFSETKDYVFKVMRNYRIYKQLYDENLNRK